MRLLEEKLEILNSDEKMLDALGMVANKVVEDKRPEIGALDNNELWGQKYREYRETKEIMNN